MASWTYIVAMASCAVLIVTPRAARAVLDIEDKGPVLNAGGFAMRVTNAGIIGNAFVDKGLSYDPSLEIHPGSGLEGLNHAALWVGAIAANGETRVSGGPLLEWRPTLDPEDRVRAVDKGEPGSRRGADDDGDGAVDEETLNGFDDDGDGEIDEDLGLFAQQMLAAQYVDDRPEGAYYVYEGGESHRPLGLTVHQEAYAWNAPGYDGIAGLSFRIKNHGHDVLRNVRIGLLADLDSRARNDRGGHLNDRIETVTYSRVAVEGRQIITINGVQAKNLLCTTDLTQTLPTVRDADPGLPLVAVVPLDHTTDPLAFIGPVSRYARAPGRVSFITTVFDRGRIPDQGGLPNVDRDRYAALAGEFPAASTNLPGDFVVLVSCGPFARLDPGQELRFDVALVVALDRDSLVAQMANAAFLQHGFMINRIADEVPAQFASEWYLGASGRTGHEACIAAPPGTAFQYDPHCPEKFLCPECVPPPEAPPDLPMFYTPGRCIWTDADCDECTGIDGNDTRIHWLDPGDLPIGPASRMAPLDHAIKIEWDNRPEILAAAGLTGGTGARFAGYRVYKLADWRGRQSLLPPRDNWALWGVFGTETRNGETALGTITDTTLDYERVLYEQRLYAIGRYAVVDSQVLNGFDYSYFVTTVIERDIDIGTGFIRTERSESSFTPRFERLVRPAAAARQRAGTVWVVPNPFRGSEVWQRPNVLGDPLTRHIDFMGLPRARSTIKIWTVAGDHVATLDHDGSAGNGQAAWNLVSRNGQEVESGIYLFTVESPLGQDIGRFVVIR